LSEQQQKQLSVSVPSVLSTATSRSATDGNRCVVGTAAGRQLQRESRSREDAAGDVKGHVQCPTAYYYSNNCIYEKKDAADSAAIFLLSTDQHDRGAQM
jgi:hypothetical protein